jgi:beta-N-acetylhexosaminidase
MSAHVVYDQLDSQAATFSNYWLGQQLRGRMGYWGLIMSDALDMQGACAHGSPSERGIKAIKAGCDLLLYCNDPAGARALVSGIIDAGIDLNVDTALLRRADAPRWAAFENSEARQSALDVLKLYLKDMTDNP